MRPRDSLKNRLTEIRTVLYVLPVMNDDSLMIVNAGKTVC